MNKRIVAILAVSLAIVGGAILAQPADASHTVDICHRTNGSSHYVEIEISASALLAHLAHPWGPDVYPVPAAGCSSLNVTPVPTPTATAIPEPTPTDIPPTVEVTPTPLEEPTTEPTAEPTDIHSDCEEEENCETPAPTPTPAPIHTTAGECRERVVGYLFHLTGPSGEVADFASFSPRPEGGYYLPNAQSQQMCLGWVAVNANGGIEITVDCNGKSNVTLIRCDGGGCSAVYQD